MLVNPITQPRARQFLRAVSRTLDPVCRAYADAIEALPAMRAWRADAERE